MKPERLRVLGEPGKDESFLGFELRITEANGYPSRAYLPREMFQRWRGTHRRNRMVREMSNRTCVLNWSDLDFRRPKVCPLCLKDKKFLPFTWDLIMWTACPTHGCSMIRECPGCGLSLHWNRGRIDRCCPGVPLSEAKVTSAPDDTIALIRLAAARLEFTADRPPSALERLTRGIPFEELSTLFVGLVRAISPAKSPIDHRELLSRRKPSIQIDEAARILVGWPNTLHAAIDVARGHDLSRYHGIRDELGLLDKRLKTLSSGRFPFILYGLRKYRARILASRSADAGVVGVSLNEICNEIGISYAKAKHILKRVNFRRERLIVDKRRQIFIRPSNIEDAVCVICNAELNAA